MRILVIDDNPILAYAMQDTFAAHGYDVDVADRGNAGEEKACATEYDAIMLDRMLPDADGVQICKNLRKRGVGTPIFLLTGLTANSDRVMGLASGADDYLTKPFELDDLVARVNGLLRRRQGEDAARLRIADLELDTIKRSAIRAGREIPLSNKEFALLEYLAHNPDTPLTKTAIARRLWDMEFDAESNVVEVYISTLQHKIDYCTERPMIHSLSDEEFVLRTS